MTTAPAAIAEGRATNYHAFAQYVHQNYRNMNNGEYISHMGATYNTVRSEAVNLRRAGFIYAHKALDKICERYELRYEAAAELCALAMKIEGDWNKPKTGGVRQEQLRILAKLAADIDFSHAMSGLGILASRVKEHNAKRAEALARAKQEAYEERLAQGPTEEETQKVEDTQDGFAALLTEAALTPPPYVAGAPMPEVELGEPKYAWTTEDLRFTITKERRGYNTLTWEGVSDTDAATFKQLMRRMYTQLPEEIQNAPAPVRDGHAAYLALVESARTSKALAKVTTNVVISADLLKDHPEWAIYYEGEFLTTEQLYELVKQWEDKHRLMITDLSGRVVSQSNVRFATEPQRVAWQAMTNKCIIPFCDCMHGLQYHHLEQWVKTRRTNTEDVCPICVKHHELVTRYPDNLTVFHDLATSVWIDPHTKRVSIGLIGHPSSSIIRAKGKELDLDPLVPEEFQRLKQILVGKTKARIKDDPKYWGA
ncbi:MAG: hypothetical protein Q3962_07750 [Corynebacterium sp.]|nr:hypothetical protein [Corynebacterium sp.]